MPKAYPPEFRRRALVLIQVGRSVVQVAADLGISQGCLYSWRTQELIDTRQLPGLSSVQSAELTAARRRIRELEAENEILHRASLGFKDVAPPKTASAWSLTWPVRSSAFSRAAGCSRCPRPAITSGATEHRQSNDLCISETTSSGAISARSSGRTGRPSANPGTSERAATGGFRTEMSPGTGTGGPSGLDNRRRDFVQPQAGGF